MYKDIPSIQCSASRIEEIEIIADRVLSRLEDKDFPLSIIALAEAHGFTVLRRPMDVKESGAIAVKESKNKSEEVKFIIVNEADPISRRRFTVAHELGHYFLHAKNGEIYAHRDFGTAPDTKAEREANIFATAILMPKNIVKKRVRELKNEFFILPRNILIKQLQLDFGVSEQTAMIRLDELEL